MPPRVEIDHLPFEHDPAILARTLLRYNDRHYEIVTGLISISPPLPRLSTGVFRLIPISQPRTFLEAGLPEGVFQSAKGLRRDLNAGCLWKEITFSEDDAAMRHQDVIEWFKNGEMLLLDQMERLAIYGIKGL